MSQAYFKNLEKPADGVAIDIEDAIDQLTFAPNQLIPVITQDVITNDVLMFAWMNRNALQQTLSTKRMTYWSRSRSALWVKGETSGHTQELVEISFDCDGDAILCRVNQNGAACHTGRKSCFYWSINSAGTKMIQSNSQLP